VLDTVQDGVNGLFFDPEQPHEIRERVLRLRDQPQLREQLAENALQHARSRSWRGTMDQLVDYYHTAQRIFRLRNLNGGMAPAG
jgi:glycosyltransferase involved in cell wall biosynthesis